MTKWVENPRGGRARGPRAIARAWFEVMVRPRRFFTTGVAPGDQAPGLVFAMAVVFVYEAIRIALVPGAVPVLAGRPVASTVLVLGVATLLVAPAVLHLVAALQTLLLIPFVHQRAGVSETVQILAYACAPCVFAGIPSPVVVALAAVYGAFLLALGTARVHRVSPTSAVILTALPSAIVFGYGFGGFAAVARLLSRWYII